MVLFCFFIFVFIINCVYGTEAKTISNNFRAILLLYNIFAMWLLVPAVIINQVCKIYFESNRDIISEKSWLGTLLLNLFFGNFGVHRFYVGKKLTGILYLMTFGFFGVGYVNDLIMLILMLFKDKSGATLVPKSFNKTNQMAEKKITDYSAEVEPYEEKLKLLRIKLQNFFKKRFPKFTNELALLEKDDDIILKKAEESTSTNMAIIELNENQHKAMKFEDIIIDGLEEKSQVIPDIVIDFKPNMLEDKRNISSKQDIEINSRCGISYCHNKFISDMKYFENKVGKECEFVPFMQCHPSYNNMNEQQKNYYFYWRSEVKRGMFLKTDLSYIFLYVYELLSGYGYKSSGKGYKLLLDVWENYRKEYPKLDRHLLSWSVDYSELHNFDFIMPNWEDMLLPYDDTIKNIIIEKYAKKLPLKLPFALIDSLCDYSLRRSKFYNDGHQFLLNEAMPRVVALADAFLYKKTGKGIFDTYGPQQSQKQIHYIYQSANCTDANKLVEISLKDYVSSPKLRSYINELVKFAENVLRKLYNYRGKLRNVELDSDTANLIQFFLNKEYSPQKTETTTKQMKVKLDFDSIKDLRIQSDAVRNVLEVTENSKESAKELLTDLQTIKELFSQLPLHCKKVIDELQKNNWKIKHDYSIQASVEKINELSAKLVAFNILVIKNDFLMLEDDFQDEFEYIYEHINEFEETNKSDDVNKRFRIAMLSAELQEFLKSLTSVQREIVYIILLKNNVNDLLDKVSCEEMSMPEILVDEINDIASQYIGDILIDTFSGEMCILEQYYDELKNAVKQEEL